MAGKEPKIATVIIKVDLGCSCCSKKIKSTLCDLQKRFKIHSIVFDEKKNTVIVSGPFNPDCFIKKLCCMAHKVIKDVDIKKPDPPPPPPKDKPKPSKPEEAALQLEVVVNLPMWPCCCQPCPCYHPHQGCCRCCSCGHVSSTPPSQPAYYGGYPCFKIVCEEEPSYGCSIM